MTNSDGCLWVFISIVFTVIAFGVLKILTGLSDAVVIVVAVILSILFTVKILGKPSGKMVFRHVLFMLIFFFGIKLMGGFLLSIIKSIENDSAIFSTEEVVTNTVLIEQNDTIPVFTSNRSWKDNFGNRYNGPLTVRERDYVRLKNHMDSYRPRSGGNFWGNLYNYIEYTDSPSLDLVMEMFSSINAEKNLIGWSLLKW